MTDAILNCNSRVARPRRRHTIHNQVVLIKSRLSKGFRELVTIPDANRLARPALDPRCCYSPSARYTLELQSWIGGVTIYAKVLEPKREELHYAILANKAPRGMSWDAAGAATTNLRVGWSISPKAYVKLPVSGWARSTSCSIPFSCSAQWWDYFSISEWLPDPHCLIGVFYFCCIVPLTYFALLPAVGQDSARDVDPASISSGSAGSSSWAYASQSA